ncbi:hypothetical protein RhiirA4_488871, partial [Rhizophagus irregularis]
GSVINNGTENIDGIAGLHFYDKDHILLEEFYVNIEHWISSSKAEVTSFILALLIIYNISNVEIITDNEFIFNYFNEITNKTEIYNTRKLLKTQNSIYIWALIRQFIDLNEIIVPKITKIKAHDDNVYHNLLDQQIKNRYSDRNRERFIRYYNEILNLENFLNLRRNRKYTLDSVEWAITFEFLKENENALQTNFSTTRRQYEKYTVDEAKLIDLFINESFGEIKVNDNKLTFVDIIKGLFPKILADFLRQEIKMTKTHIFETGVKFLDFVFESTHKIWIDRCDLQKDKERSLGVTKDDKKLYSYDKNMIKKGINHKVYQNVEGLLNNIYFNIEPLDFIVLVNHYPGSSGIY